MSEPAQSMNDMGWMRIRRLQDVSSAPRSGSGADVERPVIRISHSQPYEIDRVGGPTSNSLLIRPYASLLAPRIDDGIPSLKSLLERASLLTGLQLEDERSRLLSKIAAFSDYVYAQLRYGPSEIETDNIWRQALVLTRAYASVDIASRPGGVSPLDWGFLDIDIRAVRFATFPLHGVSIEPMPRVRATVVAHRLTPLSEYGVIGASPGALGGFFATPWAAEIQASTGDVIKFILTKIVAIAGVGAFVIDPILKALKSGKGAKLAIVLKEMWDAIKGAGGSVTDAVKAALTALKEVVSEAVAIALAEGLERAIQAAVFKLLSRISTWLATGGAAFVAAALCEAVEQAVGAIIDLF